ncbi:MAG: YhcH/YjgK/YiaL family protein [Bacteroidales bacterium]
MIIDSINSFEKYADFGEYFGLVYKFLKENKLQELEVGKYPIKGDKVWCSIWEGNAKNIDDAKLEVHDSFVDIHVLLKGEEIIGFKNRMDCDFQAPNIKYDPAFDITFLDDDPKVYLTNGIDQFVICFPSDAHMPLIGEGKIRKAIFKIAITDNIEKVDIKNTSKTK